MKSRSQLLGGVVLCSLGLVTGSACADWPTYQHDSARSGSTAERAPRNPQHVWTYRSPSRPIPAWDEPALWDGWSKVHDLKNRQVFDKAFHVVVVGERLYFGSSVDDKVYCLDSKSGDIVWTFFTEGPVRLAPTIANGRLYVGSDDGFVYCLTADTGELKWKKSVGPNTRRVAGNGRVISPWAIRTGIVSVGDTVFCGAGVIPSEGVYVVALDAEQGEERWRTEMTDLPAQGYLLASQARLYVVTSRDTPIVLDAKTGKRLYKVKGGAGGTYALLTGDTLLYGPSKTGDVNMVGGQQDVLASFQGNHMIVAKPWSYLQSQSELSSLDRGEYVRLYGERNATARQKAAAEKRLKKARDEKNEADAAKQQAQVVRLTEQYRELGSQLKACLKWRSDCACPFALILADGVLIAGGDGEVVAVDANDGQQLWKRPVFGKVYGLAVSDGQLYVSTDEGSIYCFADGQQPVVGVEQPARRPVRLQSYAGPIASSAQIPAEIHGPFAEFIAPGKVRIEWDTSEPMTSTLSFGVDMSTARTWNKDEPSKEHVFIVDDVQREVVYRFQVGGVTEEGREVTSEAYRFDAHLEYLPVAVAPHTSPYPQDQFSARFASLARQCVEAAGTRRGYALVVGAEDGRLAYELALASDFDVIVVEPDAEKAQRIQELLDPSGLYGSRIAVHQQRLGDLEYGPFLANLIVSERMLSTGRFDEDSADVHRVLRPAGGKLILGSFTALDPAFQGWRETSELHWNRLETADDEFWIYARSKLPGTGEWTHQYADADNSACSKDDQIRGEMMIQWWGRPGARPMPDRGNRNPPPVSANGRLYVQGNRTLFGLDAYNGAILWAKQIPTMRRANMPRDGSNMVAADDHVCVAIGNQCVAFEGQTGQRLKGFVVPEFSALHEYDWGYVSRIASQLFGSAVRRGSHYLGDKGEWYEGFGEKDTARVTSDSIFSINAYSGETEWIYSQGVLINSTITIADGLVFFIESRSDAARDAPSGRMLDEVLQSQVLVALDAASGKVVWEKPYDFSSCKYVTYMTHGNGTLLITGTDEKSNFHTYAFDASSGEELWQHTAPEKKGHHTGQLAHPTIVGNQVYFNKHTYELRTGKVLGVHDFNWHGCGIMSASSHSVFSRYEYHGMLDLATKQRTEFLGVRSGCWLSLIPSGGLLLAPETSAGCSCGHSIQTSLAYIPKAVAEQASK